MTPTLRGVFHLNCALILPFAHLLICTFVSHDCAKIWHLHILAVIAQAQLTISAVLHSSDLDGGIIQRLDHAMTFISYSRL